MAKLTYGSLVFSTPAETTLSAATPAKASGTTTAGPVGDFTHTTNRLTYNGTTTRDFEVLITFSATKASGGATTGKFHIAKNGSVVTNLEIDRYLANTSDAGAGAVSGAVSLATDDYIEFFIESVNGDNITIEQCQMIIKVLG